jgi:hypothetical protein
LLAERLPPELWRHPSAVKSRGLALDLVFLLVIALAAMAMALEWLLARVVSFVLFHFAEADRLLMLGAE